MRSCHLHRPIWRLSVLMLFVGPVQGADPGVVVGSTWTALGWGIVLASSAVGWGMWWWGQCRLEESMRERWETFAGSPVSQWLMSEDGKVLEVNRAALRLHGWKPDDAGRIGLEDWVPGDLMEEWPSELKRLGDGSGGTVETLRRGADGRLMEVELKGVLMRYRGRRVLLVHEQDVTERNLRYVRLQEEREKSVGLTQVQDQLRREKEAAEAANQAKTNFLAYIGHEIRTPLNGLTSAHELLMRSGLVPEQRQYLGMAVQSVEDMLTLLDDLLELTRIESGHLEIEEEDFDVRTLLENVLRSYRPRMVSSGLDLRVRVDDSVPVRLRGDSHRLRQVLTNLVSNAVKFTPAGWVEVAVTRVEGNRFRFTVSDTGIGIDPAKLGRIFEAFEQADITISRRFGGTGLGLAICRKLLGLMDGTIWVESELGKGSRFHFELKLGPAGAAEADGKSAEVSTEPVKFPENLRVLVVEDHPVNRQLTETLVRQTGVRTDTATNGREALERLAAGEYAMVLMDVQMPELDGLTATRIWRAKEQEMGRRRVPIVALTAHTQAEDRRLCLEAGMDDYLSKPLRRAALMASMAEQIGGRDVVGGARDLRAGADAGVRTGTGMTRKMLDLLRNANQEGVRGVRAALAVGDPAKVARQIHFLKGGCGLLQDPELIAELEELEQGAREGQLEAVAGRLPELEQRMETVLSHRENGKAQAMMTPNS